MVLAKLTHPLTRLIILTVAVSVLVAEAFVYYSHPVRSSGPVTEILQPTNQTPLAPLLPTDRPTSSNQPEFKVISFTQTGQANQAQIQAAQTSFMGSTVPTVASDVAIYQLKYEIKSGSTRSTTPQLIIANVYVPTTTGQYPLFVFGPGTTGIADKCAPSLENIGVENLGNYNNHMIAQAAAGYVAVIPDYEGYHNPDVTEAYFIAESEAAVMLGAIKSLVELQSTTAGLSVANLDAVFLAGYSQGGHAALSTAKAWDTLPDTMILEGVIQFAGAADVEALFLESPWLASYLVKSFTDYYGSSVQSFAVLQDKWLQEMPRNNELLCVNAANKFYPHDPKLIYTPAFLEAIESHTWPDALAPWKKVIDDNTPLTSLPDVPYLQIQGEVDPIVTAKTQQNVTQKMCRDGLRVEYREFAGVDHYAIRKASFTFTNEWLKQVRVGNFVGNCPR